MTSVDFNDDAVTAAGADVLHAAAASHSQFPISRGSSLQEIEENLTAQLVSVGFIPDPAAVKERAAAMRAAFQDGSL